MSAAARLEWAVRYRRSTWLHAQQRIYQSEAPARRLAGLLTGDNGGRWAPLVELAIRSRTVGEWVEVNE